MFSHFDLQLLLIFISLPLILSQCANEVNTCFNKFSSNLENHKQKQFSGIDQQLSDICDHKNGIYYEFVNCITKTERNCSSDTKFNQYLCETRKLKTRITRYSWKPNLFHDICSDTNSQLSRGFIEHEPCISTVLNTRKWKCDVNYDKPIKALKNWRNDLNTVCGLFKKFRDCIEEEVKQKCGLEASLISDHLFHSHQSYFEKYSSCEMEGNASTQCWYDLHKQQKTTTTPIISTTTSNTTESITKSITEQTHQSLSTNASDIKYSLAETSESIAFSDNYSSSPKKSNEITFNSLQNISSTNDTTLNEVHDILKDEKLSELQFNSSVEKESEKEKLDFVLTDNRIDSNNSDINSKLSYNHNNDKLTLSNDSDMNSEFKKSNAYSLRTNFIIFLVLVFSIKYFY